MTRNLEPKESAWAPPNVADRTEQIVETECCFDAPRVAGERVLTKYSASARASTLGHGVLVRPELQQKKLNCHAPTIPTVCDGMEFPPDVRHSGVHKEYAVSEKEDGAPAHPRAGITKLHSRTTNCGKTGLRLSNSLKEEKLKKRAQIQHRVLESNEAIRKLKEKLAKCEKSRQMRGFEQKPTKEDNMVVPVSGKRKSDHSDTNERGNKQQGCFFIDRTSSKD